jgi:rare lipoprotein A
MDGLARMRAPASLARLDVSRSPWSLPSILRYVRPLAILAALASLQACASPQAGEAGGAAVAAAAPVSAPVPAPSTPPLVEVAGAHLPVQATQEGTASWYGARFHGRLTANGEIFDKHELTAAHPTMPLPSLARVTRLDTGASVIVRINDRGPFIEGRVIDLSRAAAEALDFVELGLAEVRIEALGPAEPEDRAAVSRIVRGPGAGTAARR